MHQLMQRPGSAPISNFFCQVARSVSRFVSPVCIKAWPRTFVSELLFCSQVVYLEIYIVGFVVSILQSNNYVKILH
jgi:hypothetical protein